MSRNCVFTLFLSTEEMDRICNCNISGLGVLEKRETSCYVGKPTVYLGDPVRSFSELSAVCLIRIRTINVIHGLNIERRSEILAVFTPAVLLTSDVPPASLFHLPDLVKCTKHHIFSAMQRLKSIQRKFSATIFSIMCVTLIRKFPSEPG